MVSAMNYQVIVISRQYGSGGRQIGMLLADQLGIPFYEKEITELSAKQSGVINEFVHKSEQTNNYLFRDCPTGLTLIDEIYLAQSTTILEFAKKGPCVIVGHGTGGILKDIIPALNVFVYADLAVRKKRAIEEYGDSCHKIEKRISDIDKKRAAYFRFFTGVDGRVMENYQLCINSGSIGIRSAVDVIKAAYLSQ